MNVRRKVETTSNLGWREHQIKHFVDCMHYTERETIKWRAPARERIR
jgi:hypothetical protein